MTKHRKRKVQPPPPGIVWARDYRSEDGKVFIAGIATRLGISYETYRKWRMRDQGPVTFPLGQKVAARIEDVEAYLASLHRAAVEEAQAAREEAEHDSRPAEIRATRKTPVTVPVQRTKAVA